jgi:hypothetical protein
MVHETTWWSLLKRQRPSQSELRFLFLRETVAVLVADDAPAELVEDDAAAPVVIPVVYFVPLAPIVGSGTLPLTSHIPLVNDGHAGGVSVGE